MYFCSITIAGTSRIASRVKYNDFRGYSWAYPRYNRVDIQFLTVSRGCRADTPLLLPWFNLCHSTLNSINYFNTMPYISHNQGSYPGHRGASPVYAVPVKGRMGMCARVLSGRLPAPFLAHRSRCARLANPARKRRKGENHVCSIAPERCRWIDQLLYRD